MLETISLFFSITANIIGIVYLYIVCYMKKKYNKEIELCDAILIILLCLA